MSLRTRLLDFAAAVGADVKALQEAKHIDAGTTPPDPANPDGLRLYIYTDETNGTISVYRWE